MIGAAILLALSVALLGTTTASPVRRSRTSWRWDIEDLQNEFKGIYWHKAFDSSDCDDEQLTKLIFATRYAMKMMEKLDPSSNIASSSAWERYFAPYPYWLSFGEHLRNQAGQSHDNIRNAQTFPKKGKHPYKPRNRIFFTCKPEELTQAKCDIGARAVTMLPGSSHFETWTIFFCPEFFTDPNLKYLEHIDPPSFPVNENEVEPDGDLPANCQILDEKDEKGYPIFHCDYVGEDYDEWKANLDKPFVSNGGCELSPKCHKSVGRGVDPGCTCRCGDELKTLTPLTDERCAGFAGSLSTENSP